MSTTGWKSLGDIIETSPAIRRITTRIEEQQIEMAARGIACGVCMDTGLAPFAGSKVPCRCEKGQQIERERAEHRARTWEASIDRGCGTPHKYQSWSGERVDPGVSRHLERLRESVQRGHSTYLYGAVGRGKSALAAMVLREFVQRTGKTRNYALSPGHYGQFVTVGTLLESLKQHYRDERIEYKLGLYQSVPLLVLDDIGGPVNIKDWGGEVLYEVINARYNAELPTIYTSNLSLDQLEQQMNRKVHLLGSRIADRIHETAEVIEVNGPNFRRRT